MSALFDFNDDDDTTHELLMERLHALPVWRGGNAPVEIVETESETQV